MGLKIISALEIYTQPDDLQINVVNLTTGGWGFLIARGPGHRFKPIVSCIETPLDTKKEAADMCMQLIEDICTTCKDFISKPDHFFHCLIIKNNDGSVAPEEEWNVLKQRHLDWIKSQLLSETGVANTWEMSK